MSKPLKITIIIISLFIFTFSAAYGIWLISDSNKNYEWTYCMNHSGNHIIVSANERYKCKTIKNISTNHFTFSRYKKPFKNRFNPFWKEKQLDTINFSIFIEDSKVHDELKWNNKMIQYQKFINTILEYLYSGVRVQFDEISLISPNEKLNLNKLNSSFYLLENYLKKKGFANNDFRNVLVISDNLINSKSEKMIEAETNLYYYNKQAIFSTDIILNNPFLFVHELFHYYPKRLVDHEKSGIMICDTIKEFGAQSILNDANTNCQLFYDARKILELNSSTKVDSHNYVVWPPEADKICCPIAYNIENTDSLWILLIHIDDMLNALDKYNPYKFYVSTIALWNNVLLDEDQYLEGIKIECDQIKIKYTSEYGQNRLQAHKKFLNRNAKAGLNHLLKKKFKEEELIDVPLEMLIRQFRQENINDTIINNAFLSTPKCLRNNCSVKKSVNVSTGISNNGNIINFGKADPFWKLIISPNTSDNNFNSTVNPPNAFRIKKHTNTIGWNIINGSGILSASKSTNFKNFPKKNITWKFRRDICICKSGNVRLKGEMRADDSGILKFYNSESGELMYQRKTGIKSFLKSTYINKKLNLKEGKYHFIFELTDDFGVAAGFAMKATISSESSIFSDNSCCSN